ncbi:hypothetical protein [Nocardiopsis quinghaiensis]|uniref:hypothetical protein n=1 Tax=Nocardiopsis quinghaiensis TaxID=464995 RepID=UPI00167FF637|nr:hypothetical protein [Nocardiopsis quinghaiensis]
MTFLSALGILGTLFLLAVGIVALVRAKGSPSPGALRTTGVLMIVAVLAQVASTVSYTVVSPMGLDVEAFLLFSSMTNMLVESVYGLMVTGALIALVVALMRSRSAATRAAGPAPGHAPPPGQPYAFGRARQVPPGHGHRGHPGPRAGNAYPGGAGSYGGDAGDGTDWNPGDGGGFFGGGLFGGGDSGGGGGGDGGGGGAG